MFLLIIFFMLNFLSLVLFFIVDSYGGFCEVSIIDGYTRGMERMDKEMEILMGEYYVLLRKDVRKMSDEEFNQTMTRRREILGREKKLYMARKEMSYRKDEMLLRNPPPVVDSYDYW